MSHVHRAKKMLAGEHRQRPGRMSLHALQLYDQHLRARYSRNEGRRATAAHEILALLRR